jgi:UV DNA damage endonuclease
MSDSSLTFYGIHLGLVCINSELRKKKIFNSRTMIRKNFTVEKAKEKALLNIEDIEPLIKWNYNNGIRHMRLSSDIFPHFTDPETESYTLDFAKKSLQEVGDIANKYKHSLTFHPGQYSIVGAKSRDIFEKTSLDLSMHADILDTIDTNHSENQQRGTICTHFGAIYDDKENTTRRWIEQFDELSKNVKNRLAIEHCERCYSISDSLALSEQCNIPVIYDNLHHKCYNELHNVKYDSSLEEYDTLLHLLDQVVETWQGNTPIMHLAEQSLEEKNGKKKRIGAHSDYITEIPQEFFDIADRHGISINIEVEAKMKEQAILKLFNQYPQLKW